MNVYVLVREVRAKLTTGNTNSMSRSESQVFPGHSELELASAASLLGLADLTGRVCRIQQQSTIEYKMR